MIERMWKADQYKNVYWSTEGAGKVNASDDLIKLIRGRYGLTPEHLAMHTAEYLNKVSLEHVSCITFMVIHNISCLIFNR